MTGQIDFISSTMRSPVCIAIICCLCYVDSSSTSLPYDTIVVGLGSAGTTAVSVLAKAGRRVLALEAQGRVGGRVNTVPFRNGAIELGGEWTQGTENSLVYDAAVKYNIGLVPQDLRHEAFMSDGSRGNDALLSELVQYCLNVQDNPPKEPESVGSLITRKLREYLKEKHPDVLKDKDFVENFIEFMSLVVSNTEASDWNDISAQSGFVEIGGHQHLSWHRYGYETFFKILLNTYNNGPGWPTLDIKLNKEVTEIKWPKNSTGKVEVVCKDGDVFRADNVIVTVSLGVLKERYSNLFSPSLPQEKITAIEKMSMGVINKIILCFDEEWLPRGRLHYFLWREEDKKQISSEDAWVTKIFSCSTPMGSKEALTCWTSIDVAKLVETLPEDVVKTKVMEVLRKFMGKSYTVPEPVSIFRSKWFSNPFTRGSYTYDNVNVHEFPNARATLGEPLVDEAGVPKVLFAGEATNVNHYATVHGASETGLREAKRLILKS